MPRNNGLPNGSHLIYSHMLSHSHREVQGFPATEVVVWKGFLYEIAKEVGIPVHAIYKCNTVLESLGCIKKLKNATLAFPGVYELIKPPTDFEYNLLRERSVNYGQLRLPTKNDRMQDSLNRVITRVNELERRVKELENRNG